MNVQRSLPGDAAMVEIAEAIGEDAARELARQFGGTNLYVPKTIGDHHPIIVTIGREAGDLLAAWSGGATLAIPKQAERRERVLALRRSRSLTIAQIARETGYSERHVYRLLREEDTFQQPTFFD